MNLVVITADDLSFFTLGFAGVFPDHTPHINQLAQNGYAFTNAHCNIPFCQPSRSVLFTGKYPQNNGSTEFNPISSGIVTLPSILKEHGYFTGLMGKTGHHKPDSVYNWDRIYTKIEMGKLGRDATTICFLVEKFLTECSLQDFFLLINVHDPHRPFINSPILDGVKVPCFLPNTKTMLKELSSYLKTLERFDDTVGRLISMFSDDTLIVVTSDHGMSFPYVKGNCYSYSTNVPLIFRGPKIAQKLDTDHLVPHVDFMPTILDYLGMNSDSDGRSYKHILFGETDTSFNSVYSQLNRMYTGPVIRIRAVTTKHHNYVVNIDRKYPGHSVDGWGYHDTLRDIGNEFYSRPMEELYEYDGLNVTQIENVELKINMRNLLLNYMKKYGDSVKLPISIKLL